MNKRLRIFLALIAWAVSTGAGAALTDISRSPLEIGASNTVVKPNVMLLFDDSGSMGWDYLPDWLSGNFATPCVDKPYLGGQGQGGGGTGSTCSMPSSSATVGLMADPPYFAYQINGIYYNPNVTYPTAVDSLGNSMTASTASVCSGSNWSKVPVDGFASNPCSSTINLVGQYPETVFCNSSSPTSIGPTNCKRNGYDTGATYQTPFLYSLAKPAVTALYPNGYPDDYQTVSGTTATTTLGTYKYAFTLSGALNSGGNTGSTSFTCATKTSTDVFAPAPCGNPYYYDIRPYEYCSDTQLVNCVVGQDVTNGYVNPAYVRFCVQQSDQGAVGAVSGYTTFTSGGASSPRCQKKYNVALGYTLPRYGYFVRNDILPGYTYARLSTRGDCADYTACTYTEEMNNFANWYSYYHTRIQMAKTGVGLAFKTVTDAYRVGFLTINAYSGSTLSTSKFVPIGDFTPAQRLAFYTAFYKLTANNSTPLREALSRVGWYYAGKTSGLSSGMITAGSSKTAANPDPVQYSCQQNFVIMTTDGYWNGNAGQDLSGNSMEYNAANANQDNDLTNPYEQRDGSLANGAYGKGPYYDGNLSNSSSGSGSGGGGGNRGSSCVPSGYTSKGTLADVAMYYYKSDLRPAGSTNFNTGVDVSTDNVPTASGTDMNPSQHMVTFTIGLGVDGYLTYDGGGTYGSLDVGHIRNADTNCVWAPGASTVCNWPQVPYYSSGSSCDDPSKDDDLWHAAVNGRGNYLSAKNTQALMSGLRSDLAKIEAQTGAAASSATSTPNITQNDNFIYSTTFVTSTWDGQLQAQTISTADGTINSTCPSGCWFAQALLDAITNPTDSRNIQVWSPSQSKLVAFTFDNLDATAQAWFTNACTLLSQCGTLGASDQAIVNSGPNLVNYLRGETTYANSTVADFFVRDHVLGDLIDSRPAVVRDPRRHYADAAGPGGQTYAAYAAQYAGRQSTIYVGGNDGMLHQFDAATGQELWAYIPRMLLPQMVYLADIAYSTQHRYYVDGSPEVGDVLDTLGQVDGMWHTVMVVGLNDGGRGYFAFDVTNPASPRFLWEFCTDGTLCMSASGAARSDSDLGLSFGNAVITKRAYDHRWVVVVTSGYNNVNPGDGTGWLYELDPFTGQVLDRVSTLAGNSLPAPSGPNPSGLAKITALANNPDTDNTSRFIYGGDLLGNLWRFDLSTSPPTVSTMATLKDAAGKPQSITTRPDLGQVNNSTVVYVGTGRLLGLQDLQDPATLNPPGSWSYVSSIYALVDNGTNLGSPRTNSTMVTQTLSSFGSAGNVRSVSGNAVNIPSNIGWMIDFPSVGERVNVDPQLVLGTLIVTTNVPNSNACTAGGDGWLYQFGYASGGAVTGVANNIAGAETTSAMIVGNVVVQLPSQAVKIISTESSGSQQTSGLNTNAVNPVVRRFGWRLLPQ